MAKLVTASKVQKLNMCGCEITADKMKSFVENLGVDVKVVLYIFFSQMQLIRFPASIIYFVFFKGIFFKGIF